MVSGGWCVVGGEWCVVGGGWWVVSAVLVPVPPGILVLSWKMRKSARGEARAALAMK